MHTLFIVLLERKQERHYKILVICKRDIIYVYNLGVQPLAIFSLSPCSFKMSHDKSSHVGLYAYKHFRAKKRSESRYDFLTRAFFVKRILMHDNASFVFFSMN